MKKIPVGVVGAGHLGEAHLKKYINSPEAECVGFWDTDGEVRRRIPEKHGIKAFASLESLLENCTAVSVVIPTSGHAAVAAAAAERGVHIFVEKPLAPTLAEADRIISAAEGNSVVLQVGHIERFNSAFRSIQKDLVSPRFIESHRLASFTPRGLDVSVILDLMIHDIDIILKLMRSPLERIDASGVGVISDSFDIVSARLTFADRSVANITASRISQKSMRKMRLFQKDSYISMDFTTGESEVFEMTGADGTFARKGIMPLMTLANGRSSKKVGYKKHTNDGRDALELELGAFLNAVGKGADPPVTGSDARAALDVALKIADKTRSE